MQDKFDIVVQDLARCRLCGGALGVFGEEAHRFELNPPLSEDGVRAFEATYAVRLPNDYRQFITRVGNGGAGPYHGMFKLGEMDDGFDFAPWGDFVGQLSAPFPHTDAWNDLTGMPDADAMNEDAYDAFERRYYDNRLVDGAIPICHLGCALRQWLVVTGSEAGNVWGDDRADHKGLYPLQGIGHHRLTFFEWYRSWLNEVLAKIDLWKENSEAK